LIWKKKKRYFPLHHSCLRSLSCPCPCPCPCPHCLYHCRFVQRGARAFLYKAGSPTRAHILAGFWWYHFTR
jgi:hypothetical protein